MNTSNKGMRVLMGAYFFTANTLIFVVLSLLAVHFYFVLNGRVRIDKDYYADLSSAVKTAYKGWTPEDINVLLNSTWNTPGGNYGYSSWTGYGEKERASRFVNVSSIGFRSNASTPVKYDDLENAIWFLGGSTTFGYGVADSDTIPAQLEKLLQAKVVNMGQGTYYSAQENQLARVLLRSGYRPKEVYFLDGINERCEIGEFEATIKIVVDNFQARQGYDWKLSDAIYPFKALARNIKAAIEKKEEVFGGGSYFNDRCSVYGKNVPVEYVVQSNLRERMAMCNEYAVRCVTLIQPFAGINGVHRSLDSRKRAATEPFFKKMHAVFKDLGAVDVTNAFDGFDEQAYVDAVHYSPHANTLLAKAIAAKLTLRGQAHSN